MWSRGASGCLPAARYGSWRRPSAAAAVHRQPALTHSCRSFHHKSSRLPTTSTTTTTTTSPIPPSRHQLCIQAGSCCPIVVFPPATAIRFSRLFSSAAVNMAESTHQWPAARVRQTFLDYFAEKDHTVGEWRGLQQPHDTNHCARIRGLISQDLFHRSYIRYEIMLIYFFPTSHTLCSLLILSRCSTFQLCRPPQ